MRGRAGLSPKPRHSRTKAGVHGGVEGPGSKPGPGGCQPSWPRDGTGEDGGPRSARLRSVEQLAEATEAGAAAAVGSGDPAGGGQDLHRVRGTREVGHVGCRHGRVPSGGGQVGGAAQLGSYPSPRNLDDAAGMASGIAAA